jgi:hypothetical protein
MGYIDPSEYLYRLGIQIEELHNKELTFAIISGIVMVLLFRKIIVKHLAFQIIKEWVTFGRSTQLTFGHVAQLHHYKSS